MTKHFPAEITVSAGACISTCLLILLAPLNLVFSFYLAAAIHEFGHLLALFLFRVPFFSITFRVGGVFIQTGAASLKEELLCTLAGPFCSFLCLLVLRRFPLLSVCALIQGCFNLLPLYPMDGGRILRCICLFLCPNHADTICKVAALLTITVITTLCIFLFLHTQEHLFLFIAVYFLLQTCVKRKTPCKEHGY